MSTGVAFAHALGLKADHAVSQHDDARLEPGRWISSQPGLQRWFKQASWRAATDAAHQAKALVREMSGTLRAAGLHAANAPSPSGLLSWHPGDFRW